jgi:hypothetical protein
MASKGGSLPWKVLATLSAGPWRAVRPWGWRGCWPRERPHISTASRPGTSRQAWKRSADR